jgi:hypothetical protein
MTKAELVKALEKYPDDMDIFIDERQTDFTYGLLNSVTVKRVTFSEDPDYITDVSAEEDVIVLSEE